MHERRKITSLLLILLAFVLGWVGQRYFNQDHVRDALLMFALALAVFLLASSRIADSSGLELSARKRPDRVRSAGCYRLGVVLFSASAVLTLLGLWRFAGSDVPLDAWLFYVLGMIVFVAACHALDGSLRWPSPLRWWAWASEHRRELSLVVLILAVAAFMRFYRLAHVPAGLFFDEAMNGLDALRVLDGSSYPVYFEANFGRGSFYIYLLVPFVKFLGRNATALRVASAAVGATTALTFYLLFRQVFDPAMGIAAGLILAFARWHVNFSRIAFDAVLMLPFAALAALFIFRGLRSSRAAHFGLGGLALGLSLHTYAASRLLPFAFALLFLHQILGNRSFWRRHYYLLVIFVVAALVAFAPLGQFAVRHPQSFMSRTATVSLLNKRDQPGFAEALWSNTRKHLLMFNYRGDGNGRHNLPGAPMLDRMTAMLFVLGLGYALVNVRDARSFFFVTAFVLMLLGGILSVDFEAPQALRSFGTILPVVFFAVVPLHRGWLESVRLFRGVPRRYLAVPLAFLLGGIGVLNYRGYFLQQARHPAVWSAFHTAEANVAREMKALGPGYRFIISGFFANHPAIRFLAPGFTDYDEWTTKDSLPLRRAGEQGLAMFLEPEHDGDVYDRLRQFYPKGAYREIAPPFGGAPVAYEALLTAGDVASIQGLIGAYYENAAWQGEPALQRKEPRLDFDWSEDQPLSLPFSAEWMGTLQVPEYGTYNVGLEAPAEAEVYIDEGLVLEGPGTVEKSLTLAKGNHALRVRAVGDEGRLRLYWRHPGGPTEVVPQTVLYTSPPVTNNGLLGRYYSNVAWQGEPAFAQVDPRLDLRFHILPLPRPYSVEWTGKIQIPQTGSYAFATESIDRSWLYVDDRPVVTNDAGAGQYASGSVHLQEGLHDIRLRYTDESSHTFIKLFWRPPNRPQEIVPSHRLFPPQGAYPAGQVAAAHPPPPALEPGQVILSFDTIVEIEEGRLAEPRDLAVAPDGSVYVVDTGAGQLLHFDAEGQFLQTVADGFQQPFAVVVDGAGRIYVLDSEGGPSISQFSPKGQLVGRLGGGIELYGSRGLGLDAQGYLYVADTGGGRVVKLNRDGTLLAQFTAGGRLRQPADVAVGPDGSLYVTDPEVSQVWVLGPSDQVLSQWETSRANTYDAPHVAVGPRGEVYLTDPEGAAISVFDRQGNLLARAGERGSGAGQFTKPLGLAVDGQASYLYVADAYNSRLQRYRIGRGQ